MRNGDSQPSSQSCTTPWNGAPNAPPYPASSTSTVTRTVSTSQRRSGRSRRASPARPRAAASAEQTITTAEEATVQPAGSHASPKCRYATQFPAPRSASVAAMVSVVVRAVST